MCQQALYSYPCGHHKLLLITTCSTRRQNTQLATQLDEPLPHTPITAAKITYHYLSEGGTPIPTAVAAAATTSEEITLMTCENPSCHAGFTFDTAVAMASHLLTSMKQINTSYKNLHGKWLAKHFALQKFHVLGTHKFLAARPKLKEKLEKHKEWARVLVDVEKRVEGAEKVLYTSVADVEALKTRISVPVAWKRVVGDLHRARVELGMLRWEVEGEECW